MLKIQEKQAKNSFLILRFSSKFALIHVIIASLQIQILFC